MDNQYPQYIIQSTNPSHSTTVHPSHPSTAMQPQITVLQVNHNNNALGLLPMNNHNASSQSMNPNPNAPRYYVVNNGNCAMAMNSSNVMNPYGAMYCIQNPPQHQHQHPVPGHALSHSSCGQRLQTQPTFVSVPTNQLNQLNQGLVSSVTPVNLSNLSNMNNIQTLNPVTNIGSISNIQNITNINGLGTVDIRNLANSMRPIPSTITSINNLVRSSHGLQGFPSNTNLNPNQNQNAPNEIAHKFPLLQSQTSHHSTQSSTDSLNLSGSPNPSVQSMNSMNSIPQILKLPPCQQSVGSNTCTMNAASSEELLKLISFTEGTASRRGSVSVGSVCSLGGNGGSQCNGVDAVKIKRDGSSTPNPNGNGNASNSVHHKIASLNDASNPIISTLNNGQIVITKREHGQNERQNQQQQRHSAPRIQSTLQQHQQHHPSNNTNHNNHNQNNNNNNNHNTNLLLGTNCNTTQSSNSPFIHLRDINGVERMSMMRRILRMSSGGMSTDDTASDDDKRSIHSLHSTSSTLSTTSTRAGTTYHCPDCGKHFKHKSNLKIHCIIHTEDALECPHCQKKFARKSNLTQHLRVHTGERPYICEYCDKSFKQSHSLKDHVRIHTGEKPYECEFCGKSFKVKHNMVVHRRLHTGEKPFDCQICSKRFASKSSLNGHTKKAHPNQWWSLHPDCTGKGGAKKYESLLTKEDVLSEKKETTK